MILIIGKVPPPYGGVTIHVSRLLKKLSKTSLEVSFLKLSFINLFKSIIYVKKKQNNSCNSFTSSSQVLFFNFRFNFKKNNYYNLHR